MPVGVDFALRQGEVEGAQFDLGVAGEEAGGFVAGGVEQGGRGFSSSLMFFAARAASLFLNASSDSVWRCSAATLMSSGP